jgi:hypothetical protein
VGETPNRSASPAHTPPMTRRFGLTSAFERGMYPD